MHPEARHPRRRDLRRTADVTRPIEAHAWATRTLSRASHVGATFSRPNHLPDARSAASYRSRRPPHAEPMRGQLGHRDQPLDAYPEHTGLGPPKWAEAATTNREQCEEVNEQRRSSIRRGALKQASVRCGKQLGQRPSFIIASALNQARTNDRLKPKHCDLTCSRCFQSSQKCPIQTG